MPKVRPVTPPDVATIGRVLRRYDRAPWLPLVFAGYDCRVSAVPAECYGVVAATLFFPPGRDVAADRALRYGWRDESARYRAWRAGEADPATASKPARQRAAPAAVEVEVAPAEVERPTAAPGADTEAGDPLPAIRPIKRRARVEA